GAGAAAAMDYALLSPTDADREADLEDAKYPDPQSPVARAPPSGRGAVNAAYERADFPSSLARPFRTQSPGASRPHVQFAPPLQMAASRQSAARAAADAAAEARAAEPPPQARGDEAKAESPQLRRLRRGVRASARARGDAPAGLTRAPGAGPRGVDRRR